jgi:hypothetical protein
MRNYNLKSRMDALRQEGKFLASKPKATGAIGGPGPGRGKRGRPREPRFNQPPSGSELLILRVERPGRFRLPDVVF